MGIDEIKKRTRWALNRVIADNHLSNKTFAPLMKMSIPAVNNYRTMKTIPKHEFIKAFCSKYNYNESWFLYGVGEPFPGARAKYPEVCGPMPGMSYDELAGGAGRGGPVADPAGAFTPRPLPEQAGEAVQAAQEFKISDALAMAARVLESGTTYGIALYLNIVHFDRAVIMEAHHQRCLDEMREMKEKIDKMQGGLDEVNKTVKRLEEENRDLRGTPGSSVHTTPALDAAARTGTDES